VSDLGDDIKDTLEDIGTVVSVVGGSGSEYLDFEPNAQVTKPFIREFFLDAMVSYDTAMKTGDVIEFDVTGDFFIVMNKTPMLLENERIYHDTVLYKCNVSGEILRPSGETRDSQTMLKSVVFVSIKSDAYSLLTEPLFSGYLDTESELANIGIERQELYIPSSFGIQVLDRFEPSSGEYYLVESIRTRRFPGVDVVVLGEDTR
jgi:hypothetical protein